MVLPSPKDTKTVATFGFKVKYMARFIPLASKVVYLLQQVAKQDPLVWDEECETVFQSVKEVLGALPLMQDPNWEEVFYIREILGAL